MNAHSLSGQAILLILLVLSGCTGSGTSPARAPVQTNSATPTFAGTSTATEAPATLAVPPSPSSTAEASPTALPTEAPTTEPTVQPNPLDVSVKVDASRAVSATISNDGGTLSAAAADGTRFTLTVPGDALLLDEIITLTPVSAVDGLPLSGGMSAAVQLEPEGLRFTEPVTLTIQPPNAIDPNTALGFAYHGSGDEFHLYPAWANGETVYIPLMHFSGYGVGKGSADDIGAHIPTATEDWAEQEIARVLPGSFDPKSGLTDADAQRILAILQQWSGRSIAPGLRAASEDNSALLKALGERSAWARLTNLLLGAGGTQQAASGTVTVVTDPDEQFDLAEGAIKVDYARCRTGGFRYAAQILKFYDWAVEIKGRGARKSLDELTQLVRKCNTFKLNFNSSIVGTSSRGTRFTTHLKADDVLIELDGTMRHFTGKGTLYYVKDGFSMKPDPVNDKCYRWTYTPASSTLTVNGLYFLPGFSITDPVGDISISLDPGTPTEYAFTTCRSDKESVPVPFTGHLWKDGFIIFHAHSRDIKGGATFTGWEFTDEGGPTAIWTNPPPQFVMLSPGKRVDERTIMMLKHTPQ